MGLKSVVIGYGCEMYDEINDSYGADMGMNKLTHPSQSLINIIEVAAKLLCDYVIPTWNIAFRHVFHI